MHQGNTKRSDSIRKIIRYSMYYLVALFMVIGFMQMYQQLSYRKLSGQLYHYFFDQEVHQFVLEFCSEEFERLPFQVYVKIDGKKGELSYSLGDNSEEGTYQVISMEEFTKAFVMNEDQLGKDSQYDIKRLIKNMLHEHQLCILNPIWEDGISLSFTHIWNGISMKFVFREIGNSDFSHFE